MRLCALAAGMGRRLGSDLPKALTPLAGRPLLDHLLDRFRGAFALEEVVIVTGWKAEDVARTFGAEWQGIPVSYVHNFRFAETENGHSLLLAMPRLRNSAFWLADADVVLEPEFFDGLRVEKPTALIDDNAPDAEAMKAFTDASGRMARFSKAPQPPLRCIGETLGLNFIPAALTAELEKNLSDEKAYYEAAFNRLMENGVEFRPHCIGKRRWVEVDTPEDLERALRIYD